MVGSVDYSIKPHSDSSSRPQTALYPLLWTDAVHRFVFGWDKQEGGDFQNPQRSNKSLTKATCAIYHLANEQHHKVERQGNGEKIKNRGTQWK